jgi:hypothetical protein
MSSSDDPKSDLERNVAVWTDANAKYTDDSAVRSWARDEITWGMFGVPESELNVLGNVAGIDVVDLGCGTAFFSGLRSAAHESSASTRRRRSSRRRAG